MTKPAPILNGLRLRCGACGQGRLFSAYLKLNESCPHCGRDMRAADTAAALTLVESLTRRHGALTLAVYTTRDTVQDAAIQVSWRAKVALSFNLTGGVFVNQSAAFSDFHGTGGNPAANAVLRCVSNWV